jgi:ABC-type oligopeptide transport system substrate-binding subunit
VNLRLWLSLLAATIGAVLAAVAGFASTASSAVRATSGNGGVLRANLANDVDFVDPALAYYSVSWEIEYATELKLLNYADAEAPVGSRLVPDAAASFPAVSRDGKTYTFTLRKGLRLSDGSKVTAASFAAAINRDLNPKMASPAVQFLSDVVGANAVVAGKAAKASGVVASGLNLTIHLTHASPDFPARIAMPFFAAIPVHTAIVPQGLHTIPSAGPYYVASYTPGRQLVLKQNPFYRGPRSHKLAGVVYTIGVDPNATYLQIEKGQVDYAADPLNPNVYSDIAAKYGVNKSQFFVRPMLVLRYLALNTQRPLFKGNVALRRAVNYAIDRPALLRAMGALAGKRTTHYLPPGIQGVETQNLYPMRGADVSGAKKLAAGHTRDGKAVLYTCTKATCAIGAQILQYNLKQIGIDLSVQQFTTPVQLAKMGTKGEPFDIGWHAWTADYADPSDFLNVLLDGSNIRATNNQNFAYFDDAKYEQKLQAAAKLTGDARYKAYGQLDVDLAAHAAPWAAWANANARIFVSKHVGCFTYNPVYGTDLTQLCTK